MRVGIIGKGAIAGYVTEAIAAHTGVQIVGHVLRQAGDGGVTSVTDLPSVDLLVDCAGHAGLAQHGAEALARGIDVLTLSLGALADVYHTAAGPVQDVLDGSSPLCGIFGGSLCAAAQTARH